jgi:hypothetical protein
MKTLPNSFGSSALITRRSASALGIPCGRAKIVRSSGSHCLAYQTNFVPALAAQDRAHQHQEQNVRQQVPSRPLHPRLRKLREQLA